MSFKFATASRILFGTGIVNQLGEIASLMGNTVLLVTNLPEVRVDHVASILAKSRLPLDHLYVPGEPTVTLIAQGVEFARQRNCEVVIGLGGGSAIDSGKAIASLLTNPGEVLDYLEVIGKGHQINNPSIPYIAVPTTSGTGAEVTRNAVIGAPEQRVKVSLRSRYLLPKVALVDPELTYGLPPEITASTGLDALTQLMESYVSIKANPLTDAICREGLMRVANSLRRAYHFDDPTAREEMSIASLFGGLALANSGLGIVHGFASVLGGMYPIPHGVVCAALLPTVMEFNIYALQERNPESTALKRYCEIAQILAGKPKAQSIDGIIWVHELCEELKVPSLSVYGIPDLDYLEIIDRTIKASSTKANPIQPYPDELEKVLRSLLT